MTTRILVIGRSGQVAHQLAHAPLPKGVTLEALGRDRFDILDLPALRAALEKLQPAAVINAATAPGVDRSEAEPDLAFLINRQAPHALARACRDVGVALVHLSTDCVFDGAKSGPYCETDLKAPLSVYGRSKAEGEDAVLNSGANAAVLRTSWLFSAYGVNFVRTMLQLAHSREEIRVVCDQHGNPTYTPDLAQACVALALWLRSNQGQHVFHYAGLEAIDRAAQAGAIFEAAQSRGLARARVVAVMSADYQAPARRPLNARLNSTKIAQQLGLPLRAWSETLPLCMEEIAALED